jgi:Domain of unknown function (DUF397)
VDKLDWFRSSYSSGNGECAECARTAGGGMAVGDSKHPPVPGLALSPVQCEAFRPAIRIA